MRIRMLLTGVLDTGPLLQVVPEKLGPRENSDARRQRCSDLYTRSLAWSTQDLQFRSDAGGALPHPPQTKAAQIPGLCKPCTVVGDNHAHEIPLKIERDRKVGRTRMAHSVSNRFLPDPVESIGDTQRHRSRLPAGSDDDLYSTSLYHLPRTGFKRGEQVSRLQRFRTKHGDTPARLFMTMIDQVAGQIELMVRNGHVCRNTVSNRFQLEADTREALRQRVVHFMGEPLSLVHDCA